MKRKALFGPGVAVVVVALAGCAVPAVEAAPEPTGDVAPSAAAPADPRPTASATPAPTHPVDPRDTAYDAEVAAWDEPIPQGFAWPDSITGLPTGRWHTHGDWAAYLSADGIYHCMLVYAAWDAYFVDNDAPASKQYAALADATMPEQEYPTWVTRDDGTIRDQDLASESGICNGFVGDLRV